MHFLLYGSFEATIWEKKVTGDYPTRNRPARLSLEFSQGQIIMYNCSLTYIESANAKESCDFTINIMSNFWDSKQALLKIKEQPESEIADVLLDQSIFKGVGNIICKQCGGKVARKKTGSRKRMSYMCSHCQQSP